MDFTKFIKLQYIHLYGKPNDIKHIGNFPNSLRSYDVEFPNYRRIIKRKRIYFLNESVKRSYENKIENNELQNNLNKNQKDKNFSICLRCKKYIFNFNLINIRIMYTDINDNNYTFPRYDMIIDYTCC